MIDSTFCVDKSPWDSQRRQVKKILAYLGLFLKDVGLIVEKVREFVHVLMGSLITQLQINKNIINEAQRPYLIAFIIMSDERLITLTRSARQRQIEILQGYLRLIIVTKDPGVAEGTCKEGKV